MLSRYRSGLEQGRSAAVTRPERVAAPDEQQPSSDPGSALRAAPPPPPAPGGFEPHHLADADHAERDRPVGEDRAWPR